MKKALPKGIKAVKKGRGKRKSIHPSGGLHGSEVSKCHGEQRLAKTNTRRKMELFPNIFKKCKKKEKLNKIIWELLYLGGLTLFCSSFEGLPFDKVRNIVVVLGIGCCCCISTSSRCLLLELLSQLPQIVQVIGP